MLRLKMFYIIIVLLVILSCHTHKHSNDSLKEVTDYFGAYELKNKKYGTKTTVSIEGDQRKLVTNALPNHETGTFPNQGNPNTISAQNITYTIPLKPKYTGQAKFARTPGVALNGIKFEPQTGEMVQCESGENYRIEAIQDILDMGLDHNHAHVQPTGAYHYHGAPTGILGDLDEGKDLVHIGFGMDGFPIYYSKSGTYKPSFRLIDESREGLDCTYKNPMTSIELDLDNTKPDGSFVSDWEYIPGYGDLDECNGITVDGQYMYVVTDNYPYVGRCLKGEFKEERRGPPRGRGRGPETGPGGRGGQGPPPGEREAPKG